MIGRWVLCVMLVLSGCTDQAPTEEIPDSATLNVISGTIIDAQSEEPLEGARVSLDEGTAQVDTDEDGVFTFERVLDGAHVLEVEKHGYFATATTAASGTTDLAVSMKRDPGTYPFWSMTEYEGYLACAVTVIFSTFGCSMFPQLADATGTEAAWLHEFQRKDIRWTQGELLWDAGAGSDMMIWEVGGAQFGFGGGDVEARDVSTSPALVFATDSFFAGGEQVASEGVSYRFYGGPHSMCQTPFGFGCGVTLQQGVTAYVHDFYGTMPPLAWRFTDDGDPVPPS